MKMKDEMSHREPGFTKIHTQFPVSSSQAGGTGSTPCTPAQPCNKERDETQIHLELVENTGWQLEQSFMERSETSLVFADMFSMCGEIKIFEEG